MTLFIVPKVKNEILVSQITLLGFGEGWQSTGREKVEGETSSIARKVALLNQTGFSGKEHSFSCETESTKTTDELSHQIHKV